MGSSMFSKAVRLTIAAAYLEPATRAQAAQDLALMAYDFRCHAMEHCEPGSELRADLRAFSLAAAQIARVVRREDTDWRTAHRWMVNCEAADADTMSDLLREWQRTREPSADLRDRYGWAVALLGIGANADEDAAYESAVGA